MERQSISAWISKKARAQTLAAARAHAGSEPRLIAAVDHYELGNLITACVALDFARRELGAQCSAYLLVCQELGADWQPLGKGEKHRIWVDPAAPSATAHPWDVAAYLLAHVGEAGIRHLSARVWLPRRLRAAGREDLAAQVAALTDAELEALCAEATEKPAAVSHSRYFGAVVCEELPALLGAIKQAAREDLRKRRERGWAMLSRVPCFGSSRSAGAWLPLMPVVSAAEAEADVAEYLQASA